MRLGIFEGKVLSNQYFSIVCTIKAAPHAFEAPEQ
jgi:hypothetical protein